MSTPREDKVDRLFNRIGIPRLPEVFTKSSVKKPSLQDIQDSMGKRHVEMHDKRDAEFQARMLSRDMMRNRKRMRWGF